MLACRGASDMSHPGKKKHPISAPEKQHAHPLDTCSVGSSFPPPNILPTCPIRPPIAPLRLISLLRPEGRNHMQLI